MEKGYAYSKVSCDYCSYIESIQLNKIFPPSDTWVCSLVGLTSEQVSSSIFKGEGWLWARSDSVTITSCIPITYHSFTPALTHPTNDFWAPATSYVAGYGAGFSLVDQIAGISLLRITGAGNGHSSFLPHMSSHSPLSLPSGPSGDRSSGDILVWHLPEDEMQLPTQHLFPWPLLAPCRYRPVLEDSPSGCCPHLTLRPLQPTRLYCDSSAFSPHPHTSPFLFLASFLHLTLCLNVSRPPSYSSLRSLIPAWVSSNLGCPTVLTQLLSI